jgi:hypothetical protein
MVRTTSSPRTSGGVAANQAVSAIVKIGQWTRYSEKLMSPRKRSGRDRRIAGAADGPADGPTAPSADTMTSAEPIVGSSAAVPG